MNQDEFEELIFLWQEYAKEKDSALTVDAQKLKAETVNFIWRLPPLPTSLVNREAEKK